jgi:hypothetical protein
MGSLRHVGPMFESRAIVDGRGCSVSLTALSAVLNSPGTRAERPKSIFHGALMMPDTRLRVSVGPKTSPCCPRRNRAARPK